MARRKKRKHKDKPPAPVQPADPHARRLETTLVELEIARGHDGLLRGKPEPVLLVGAYLANAGSIRLLGRSLSRLVPVLPFPSSVKLSPPYALLFDRPFRAGPAASIVLLALAFEEDAGTDVTRLYADLETPPRLRIWPLDASMPVPRTLDEVAHDPMWDRHATRVHVLAHDADIRDACLADKFIGACLLTLSNVERLDDCFRLHFLADNGLNDWTATLRVILR